VSEEIVSLVGEMCQQVLGQENRDGSIPLLTAVQCRSVCGVGVC